MDASLSLETYSYDQTHALGGAFATLLLPGMVIALHGDLAAGKTCFVHGIGEALKVAEPVNSPTFTLVNEYHGEHTLFHLDLYRLTTAAELFDLGYEDILNESDGICLIEWAERAESVLPKNHISVALEHAGEDHRRIVITDAGQFMEGWQETLRASLV